jgi:hypothetical protein
LPATRRWATGFRFIFAACSLLSGMLLFAPKAGAEKVLFKDKDWEVYTDGRVGGFVSYVFGDGLPQQKSVALSDGSTAPLWDVVGGGWQAAAEVKTNDPTHPDQGKVSSMRVRSGFIGNVLGIGVRNQLMPNVKVTGYFQIWAYIESLQRAKNQPNMADVRQGYAKVDAPWGTFTVGRMRCLFSRGATDIDVMYAHRWGVGFPSPVDSNGPTLGQIGFGVLGSGFAGGLMYGTPTIAGLHLDVGLFEPIALTGKGAWSRTQFVRPEGELTFEQAFGLTGKVVLFANGAAQKLYKNGYCDPNGPGHCDATAAGFGYGGRFEYGPVHLGVAGHRGKGLGLNYALEVSDAAQDFQGNLRIFDGYYVQTQFVIGPVEPFAGIGIARVFLTTFDKQQKVPDPRDPTGMGTMYPHSFIKNQMGINGGVVYHVSPNIHVDVDYFRAQSQWYLGEQQTLNAVNGGMTFSW